MNDYLIHVSNEQSFLVEQVHIHNNVVEVAVHEVSKETLTHFINTLWIKPKTDMHDALVMDDDGNRYQVQSVERLTKSRKSTLGIA